MIIVSDIFRSREVNINRRVKNIQRFSHEWSANFTNEEISPKLAHRVGRAVLLQRRHISLRRFDISVPILSRLCRPKKNGGGIEEDKGKYLQEGTKPSSGGREFIASRRSEIERGSEIRSGGQGWSETFVGWGVAVRRLLYFLIIYRPS